MKKYILFLSIFIVCGGSELTEGSLIITTDTDLDTTTTITVEDIATTIPEENIPQSDNYLDYLRNTQSESDYNSFYISKFESFDVDVNEEYLNQ